MCGVLVMNGPQDILTYWFGDADGDRRRLWFGGGKALDAEIRDRYGDLVEEALRGGIDHWAKDPRGRLALVIVLDQFARNVYRSDPRAFRGDHAAQRHAVKATGKGEDDHLRPIERAFLYMPLMHAEDPRLQDKGVALYERLLADAPANDRALYEGFLAYARDHAAIVHRFGRFPDRDHLLGRETSAEERRFLKEEARPWFETERRT